jgi:hypothetical protein
VVRAGAIFIVLIGFVGLMIVLEYAQLQAEQFAVGGDGLSAASVAWRMQVACLFSQPIQTPPHLAIDIFWSTAALIYYLNILTKLKSRRGENYAFSFVYRGIFYLLGGKPAQLPDYGDIYESRRKWISDIKPRFLQIPCKYLARMEAAYLAIKTSVSADIPWLFFVLIYCLAQLKTVWLDNDAPFWDPSIQSVRLGVGQIMALILLTGLLLNGVSSFIDAWPTEMTIRLIADSGSDDIEAACVWQGPGQILEKGWFRNYLIVLSGWNMAVLIYAGIISGGPWDVDGLNISVVCLISSLFIWEFSLEFCNLVIIILSKFWKRN